MNQPNCIHPNTADQATQAPGAMEPSATPGLEHGTSHPIHAYPAPAAMEPSATPGHEHGTSHPIPPYPGAYNQGAAPHAPYPFSQGYTYPPQGAYPPVAMPPPPQPAPNRQRGCFMACFEAVFCCCLRNANLGDANGGDVCNCGDCFDAGDMCFIM